MQSGNQKIICYIRAQLSAHISFTNLLYFFIHNYLAQRRELCYFSEKTAFTAASAVGSQAKPIQRYLRSSTFAKIEIHMISYQ